MQERISGVYKIENTLTGDFYIGSSKNVKKRWAYHKCPSSWKEHPNSPMYYDMQKYGVDKFDFQILEEVEPGHLKEKEQQFIEKLKPTYNNYNANGINIERMRKSQKKAQIKYEQSDKRKEQQKEYYQQNREAIKEYLNQLCSYNGEVITLNALYARFQRAGIERPKVEAKKYLIKN